MKKIISLLFVVLLLSMMVVPVVMAEEETEEQRRPDMIENRLEMEQMETQIETAVTNIIRFIRFIAMILTVLMVILLAASLIGEGNERSMATVKTRALYLVIALFVLFQAERIVGFLVGMFDPTKTPVEESMIIISQFFV